VIKIKEQFANSSRYCGMGQKVMELINQKTEQTIACVGILNDETKIYFERPCSIKEIEAAIEYLKNHVSYNK